jgi:hypothetical protein
MVVIEARVHTAVPKALLPGEAAIVDGLAVVKAADDGVALLVAEVGNQTLEGRNLALLVARAGGK